jgi:hypothetical protein
MPRPLPAGSPTSSWLACGRPDGESDPRRCLAGGCAGPC